MCLLDLDVIKEITDPAKSVGIKLYTSSKVEEIVQGEDQGCIVRFTNKDKTKYISSDKVLVCVGRCPEYEDIGLEEMKIEINNEYMGITVNNKMDLRLTIVLTITGPF